VSFEYTRTIDPAAHGGGAGGAVPGAAARTNTYATVEVMSANGQENLAMVLVLEGLIEVVKHRMDDARSSHYDELCEAEERAETGKRGRFAGKAPAPVRITDLTSDSTKARSYQTFLQRGGALSAVVQGVITGSRIRVYIPKENCLLTFGLTGVRSPQPARPASTAKRGRMMPSTEAATGGEEAKAFARARLMQRNVTIKVEDMDKGGCAFGPLLMAQVQYTLSHTLLSYTPLIHSSHTLLSYTPLIHYLILPPSYSLSLIFPPSYSFSLSAALWKLGWRPESHPFFPSPYR
jgi:endonuclease YncB( thermonuclease family)